MISLSISRFEEADEDILDSVLDSMFSKFEELDAYKYPVFCDRRVGFVLVKYFETYYKFPHRYVPDGSDLGYEIKIVCPECFNDRMYDEHSNSYYCPYCIKHQNE